MQLVSEIYGTDIKCMEATAECGYFVNQIQNCTALALGIPVYQAHSPDEMFYLEDFENGWIKLERLMSQIGYLAGEKP